MYNKVAFVLCILLLMAISTGSLISAYFYGPPEPTTFQYCALAVATVLILIQNICLGMMIYIVVLVDLPGPANPD